MNDMMDGIGLGMRGSHPMMDEEGIAMMAMHMNQNQPGGGRMKNKFM